MLQIHLAKSGWNRIHRGHKANSESLFCLFCTGRTQTRSLPSQSQTNITFCTVAQEHFLQTMHYLLDRLAMKQDRVLLCRETVAQDCQELPDKNELRVIWNAPHRSHDRHSNWNLFVSHIGTKGHKKFFFTFTNAISSLEVHRKFAISNLNK